MDHNQLIGGVAAAYFASRLRDADTSSTARYLLDSMSAEQTAEIAKAILAALESKHGNVKEASSALGIDRSTLYDKLKRYEIVH